MMTAPAVGEKLATRQAALRALVDAELSRRTPKAPAGRAGEAVRYALLSPGKRIRPILMLLATEALRGDEEKVLPAACSVEMVHCSSLLLDDLPCMDDAARRRGRPTVHVAFGEATAILAGMALLSEAFHVAAGCSGGLGARRAAEMASVLSRAVGLEGLVAGQDADLASEGRSIGLPELEFIHSRKTGALFIASAEMAAVACGAPQGLRECLAAYAKNIGLAFQITDDILDATSTPEALGKDTGKDARRTTFVTFAGVDGSRKLTHELIAAAQCALAPLGRRARLLRELAAYVETRTV